MTGGNSIDILLERYRESAARTATGTPEEGNKHADTVHECYKILRAIPDGRAGIFRLMNDGCPEVRLWAASHSLAWSPEVARNTLEYLRENAEFPTSFSAEMTLQEYDNGTLTFDY